MHLKALLRRVFNHYALAATIALGLSMVSTAAFAEWKVWTTIETRRALRDAHAAPRAEWDGAAAGARAVLASNWSGECWHMASVKNRGHPPMKK